MNKTFLFFLLLTGCAGMRAQDFSPAPGLSWHLGDRSGHLFEEDIVWARTTKYKKVPDSVLSSLSLRQQFVYHMVHPEAYAQLCGLARRPTERNRIYAQLGEAHDEWRWASRQRQFLLDHRDSVIGWLGAIILADGKVIDKAKDVIVLVKGREMIPQLVKTYRETGDNDILTVLLLLMVQDNYEPFRLSELYKVLYGEKASYRSFVAYTPKDEQWIIRLATAFLYERGSVWVPRGRYVVGKKGEPRNPLRTVWVDSFRIAVYETTNRQFEAFVAATGYVTDAERQQDAMVFQPGLEEFEWIQDSTAWWRYPNGVSRGDIKDKMDHPVTCISYTDILAYCAWAKVRLPTLDEWEIACRAGTTTDYFFGKDDSRIGEYANIWHGRDHMHADHSDGYMYTAPVGSYKPNPWGLYDMYGNVFEFCSGRVSPSESKTIAHARGGSWWCSEHTCQYFNSYDIGLVNIHASFSNQGFRVVR